MTFFQTYDLYIIAVIALCVGEAVLIAWLLELRSRRRQAEEGKARIESLAKAEHQRMDEVVSNMPGVVWEVRIDPLTQKRKTTFVSPYVETMMGYTVDEWLASPGMGLRIVHDDDRERVRRETGAILASKKKGALEFRWIAKDGRVVSVVTHVTPILDVSGTVVGMCGSSLDISAQKSAEAASRGIEERNRAILQAIPDLMFLQNRDGTYLDYHANFKSDLLVPPEKFLGKNMYEVLPLELADRFRAKFDAVWEGGNPQILEYDLLMTGGQRWFEARIVRSGDSLLTIVREITERKSIEETLSQSRTQLKGIIESAMDAIITIDARRHVVMFNAAAEKMFSCSRREAIGKPIDRFVTQPLLTPNGDQFGFRPLGEKFPIEASVSHTDQNGHTLTTLILRDVTERRRAEEALRQSEEKFSKAFRANPQPMSITTLSEGRYIDVNESFLTMSGYRREEAIGHTSLELGIWETPERRAEFVRGLVQTGSVRNVETKFRTKSGEFRVLLSSSELLEIRGELCLIVASSDITERMAAQLALRESEDRFRTLADSSPVLIWVNGLNGCEFVNRSYLEFVGRSMDEVMRMDWTTAIHPDDVARYIDSYKVAFESQVAFEAPFRYRRFDGEYRWFKSIGLPRFTADGTFIGYVGSSLDITDIKNVEEALRESEARFRYMADHAPVMIWVSGSDKQSTYFNKNWLEFTGHTLEEELSDGWKKGLHADDAQRCLHTFDSAFDKKEAFRIEYRLRRSDGAYRWVLDCGAPRCSSDGEFLGFIGSCIDITERKESEQALEKAHRELNELKNDLEAENIYLQAKLNLGQPFAEIVGESEAVKYVHFKIGQVAPTDSTVLITGDTGTGKELVARAIHSASKRSNKSLIKVNCAALSPTLIESELFGHEKGAFTGAAARKIGRFELADGGTIFLDEIGELPLESQVKLLRVIQEGEIERVGGSKTLTVDVRIIAATNRDLKAEVDKGTFRQDLWYRLNVFPITVPPLSQRRDDIPLLVEHFIEKSTTKFNKTIKSVPVRTMQKLQAHSWPGNIRELANVLERAVIHSQGNVLQLADRFDERVEDADTSPQSLEKVERDYIIRTLENTGWRIEGPHGAAKVLGLNPSTLRTRMSKLQIQRRSASVNMNT
ncbi:MAG TPA: PAS domain S-box protein [Pyrinomonadaceae bacterium]|nr:PAS domain S-box protein [Pyrinomonadaceae bacterium]